MNTMRSCVQSARSRSRCMYVGGQALFSRMVWSRGEILLSGRADGGLRRRRRGCRWFESFGVNLGIIYDREGHSAVPSLPFVAVPFPALPSLVRALNLVCMLFASK